MGSLAMADLLAYVSAGYQLPEVFLLREVEVVGWKVVLTG